MLYSKVIFERIVAADDTFKKVFSMTGLHKKSKYMSRQGSGTLV